MIRILEDNAFFIVIEKPAGLSVHNQSPSVLDCLKALGKPDHFVNRLDQETSGLMIIAQKPEWHEPLRQALDQGEKIYRALLRSPWKDERQNVIWSWPLSDKAEGRRQPDGHPRDQKDCRTEVLVVRSNKYFTEILATLKSGRQHQIRKHSALARHPIVGDPRYNDEKYNTQIAGFYHDSRMQLHAEQLRFDFRGQNYSFLSEMLDLKNYFTVSNHQ